MTRPTLFVYYKLLPSDHSKYLGAISKLKSEIAKLDPLLDLEVLQRPDVGSDGHETWMEIYRHPQGVSDALMEKIQEIVVLSGLPTMRKSEIFIPLQ
jgi:hypothetical protein